MNNCCEHTMEKAHKDVLRCNRSWLTSNITDLDKIVDDLMGDDIITEGMFQDIFAAKTKNDQIKKFLDLLPRRGPKAFKAFCDALQANKQFHVTERINPSYSSMSGSAQPVPSSPNPVPSSNSQPKPQPQTQFPQPVQFKPNAKPVPKDGPKTVHPRSPETPVSHGATAAYSGQPINYIPPSTEPLFKHYDDWPKEYMLKEKMEKDEKEDLRLEGRSDIYRFKNTKNRGRALIISNRIFSNDRLQERTKVDLDASNISDSLRQLDFKCFKNTDLTEAKLRAELAKEAKKEPPDVFVLVILSYGGKGTVLCSDDREISIQELVNLLSSSSCPALKDVPKLIFLQACGTMLKDNTDPEEYASLEKSMKNLHLGLAEEDQTDTRPGSTSDDLQLQDTRDILVAVATMPDPKPEETNGSLFIYGLAYTLCHYAKSDHILEILNKVNRLKRKKLMSSQSGDESKCEMLCSVRHSLTRYLYLMPGYKPHPRSDIQGDLNDFQDVRAGRRK